MLDAGCGAGYSALELLDGRLDRIRYLGVDVSSAVDVAAERFAESWTRGRVHTGRHGAPSVRRPDRERDLLRGRAPPQRLDARPRCSRSARLLDPGGRFLFYVYNRKGPVREFTDDLHPRQAPGDGARARRGMRSSRSRSWAEASARSTSTLDIRRSDRAPRGAGRSDLAPAVLLLARLQDVLRPRAHPRRAEPHQLRLVRAAATRTARRRSRCGSGAPRPAWKSNASAWRRLASRSSPAESHDSPRVQADGRR